MAAATVPVVEMKWGQEEVHCVFVGREYVYVHCVSGDFPIRFQNCPVYGYQAKECHISFLGHDQSTRYAAVIISNDDVKSWLSSCGLTLKGRNQLGTFPVPKLLNVEDSFYAQWVDVAYVSCKEDADHVTIDDKRVSKGTVIAKWTEMATTGTVLTTWKTTNIKLPKVTNNTCAKCVPKIGKKTSDDKKDKEKKDDQPQQQQQGQLNAELAPVMGSHKEKRYQTTLKKVVQVMSENKDVPICLDFDPNNKEDKNAIVVSVDLDDKKQPVGTIPKRKIIKVSKAMNSKAIKSIIFENVPHYEPIKDGIRNQLSLTCTIVILKYGAWGNDASGYMYNDNISDLV